VDVSGDWADLPLSKNLVTVKLTSNDLRDSPIQKGGFLKGQTVTVDVRKGDPQLFDVSGYVGAIPRTAAEKASTGGSLYVYSQGDIVLRQRALLDVSGGGYRFASGYVASTLLVSSGTIYNISSAPPDLQYQAIIGPTGSVTSQRWNVTRTFAGVGALSSSVEPGYLEGKPGGTLTLNAPSVVLDGSIRGDVTASRYQVASGQLPTGATLNLGDPTRIADSNPNFRLATAVVSNAYTPLPQGFQPTDPLPPDRVNLTVIPSGLMQPSDYSASGQ